MKSAVLKKRSDGLAVRIGYGVAGLGAGAVGVPVQLFVMIYLTDAVGVLPSLAGLIVAAPKLWDMAVDAPLGGWCSRLAHRAGGQWPLTAMGAFGLPLCLIMVFAAWRLGGAWQTAAAVAVGLIAFSTLTTVFMVGHTALADDLTADPAKRTALFGGRSVATCIGGVAASIAAPQLLAAGGGQKDGYLHMALVIGAIGVAVLAISFLSTRRVPLRPAVGNAADTPVWRAIRATLRNRTFYVLFFVLVLQGLAATQLNLMLPYVNQQLVHGGPNVLSALFAAMLGALILGIPVMSWLAMKVGATRALQVATCISLVGVGGYYFSTFLPPWAIVVAAAVTGFAQGAYALLIQSAVIDAAKAPVAGAAISIGVYLGILFAGEKLGASLAGLASGVALDVIGLKPGEQLVGPALEIFRAWFGLAPAIFLIATLALLHLSNRRQAMTGLPASAD